VTYKFDNTLLGPAEAPLAKIKDRYRWHMLVKAPPAGPRGSASILIQ
jgi:primosomal protein N'